MTIIDEYLAKLNGPEQAVIEHMNQLVRKTTSDATEEEYYGMPAFKWNGKGLISILANKNFMSIYPYCAVSTLGLDLLGFECTSGSIHFTIDKPVSDELLTAILTARKDQIAQYKRGS